MRENTALASIVSLLESVRGDEKGAGFDITSANGAGNVDGSRDGSDGTKEVWKIPPLWTSATVQMSKMSFVSFCLVSLSDLVLWRFFLNSEMASVMEIFSHSAMRIDFETRSSSSL